MLGKSNVLFLLADQWQHDAFSFRGHAWAKTPNIDRLAKGASVFKNAYTTCPLCGPARGSLMTGLWPHQNGMVDNMMGGWSKQDSLDLSRNNWLSRAKESGYRTGYFGKWHLGPDGPTLLGAETPEEGIDTHLKVGGQKGPYDDVGEPLDTEPFKMNKGEFEEGSYSPFYACLKNGIEDCPDFHVANGALGFLDTAKEEEPWFLTASFPGPHFPHNLPKNIFEMFDPEDFELPANFKDDLKNKPWVQAKAWWPCQETSDLGEVGWKKTMAAYFGMLYLVDQQIGRLIDRAEEVSGDRPLTLLFAADHGEMLGAHAWFDKGAHFYEEEVRLPIVLRLPEDGKVGAQVAEPRFREEFVSFMDVGATLFGLADGTGRYGRDLIALLRGHSEEAFPDELFSVYNYYNGHAFVSRMLRSGRMKYVFNPQSIDELYDLEEDPGELRNLYNVPAYGDRLSALRRRLFEWMEEVEDPLRTEWPFLPPAGKRDMRFLLGK